MPNHDTSSHKINAHLFEAFPPRDPVVQYFSLIFTVRVVKNHKAALGE